MNDGDEGGSEATIHALFASDLAQDVRSEFNARRDEGLSAADATGAVVAHFRHLLERAEEGPVVIIAIAVLQLLERAPTATFLDAALELLRDGHGFATRAGEDLSFRRNRERLREQLIEMLESATILPEEPGMS
ncbi:MAG TPA: hypothetical protein VGR35_06435 [Tepidisphaeraceae bacterium]|nr:hypothetical protein [Tepidisphaeraceae bacterium]